MNKEEKEIKQKVEKKKKNWKRDDLAAYVVVDLGWKCFCDHMMWM